MKTHEKDPARNQCMLTGSFAYKGYDWWWHSFTAHHEETGEPRAFFVEYFLINPELGGKEPRFGLAPDDTRGHAPSYLMVKAGAWGMGSSSRPGNASDALAVQLHRFFGWDDVEVGWGAPYWVQADDCFACDTDLLGSVCITARDAAAHPEWMCDAGEMAWDLHLEKDLAFNVGYGASKPLRDAHAFEMYWHAEGMKTRYSGVVVYNGERYLVDPETSYGYADKNWGSDFTSPWVWLASSNLTSRLTGKTLQHTAFDIGGGRPCVAGIHLNRKLLGCIHYEGTDYEFNFSKFWTGSATQFDCREEGGQVIWHVQQDTLGARLVTDVTCEKADMLKVHYESPDGMARHDNLWNGGNGVGRLQLFEKHRGKLVLIDDMDARNIGCEFGEYPL